MEKHDRAFTLIELSIVLVIIGLIVGGVLVGRDLIRASEIRATIAQIEKLNTAVNTFKTKFNAIPGDIKRAEALALGFYYITYGPYINYAGYGDGDGIIHNGEYTGTPRPFTQILGEPLMFFRHLSDAKLIDGKYGENLDTAAQINTTGNEIAAFLPLAKIGQNSYIQANSPGDGYNYYVISNVTSVSGNGLSVIGENTLSASQASNIDQKLDDGLPATGNVIAINTTGAMHTYAVWTTVSALSGCVASSAYAVTQNTPSCSLRIKFQ